MRIKSLADLPESLAKRKTKSGKTVFEEYTGAAREELAKTDKPNKYHAQKTNGFDSRKESNYHSFLLMRERAGEIENLRCQVPFEIIINGEKICKYIADFVYLEHGREIVVDVKSEFTKKLPVYRLKKKLMKAVLGIEITEAC